MQEQFSYIVNIISRWFYKVLDALLYLYPSFVTLLNINTPLASWILNNFKYFLYFENCLSVLNSTYILIHMPLEEQAWYCN